MFRYSNACSPCCRSAWLIRLLWLLLNARSYATSRALFLENGFNKSLIQRGIIIRKAMKMITIGLGNSMTGNDSADLRERGTYWTVKIMRAKPTKK